VGEFHSLNVKVGDTYSYYCGLTG